MENLVTSVQSRAGRGLPTTGFWHGRRVMVTGHTGFIGGWTCAWLHRLGAQVFSLGLRPATVPSFHELAQLERRVAGRLADIRDADALAKGFAQARPQIVIHLAAQPLVATGYERPAETFATNVMGTVNVLDQVRRNGPDAIVVMTSDKVYRDTQGRAPHVEGDPLGPADPYGNSKACCELAVDCYARSFLAAAGIGVASVRAGNVIGGGDWSAGRLIPDAVRAFATGRTLSLRHPGAVRPWQHVLDVVSALLVIAEAAAEGRVDGAWNIGPTDDRTVAVETLAAMFADAWEEGEARIDHDGPHEFPETQFLALDPSRAQQELAMCSPWSLREAVERTAYWYRQALAGADAWSMTLDQIDDYRADRLALAAAVLPFG
jgi:CDP-glucose 4,6-dehydratase